MKQNKINFSFTLIFAIFLIFLEFTCKKIEPVLAFTKYVNAELRIVNTSNSVAAKIERTVSEFKIFTANGEHASKYASNLDKQSSITDKACKKYNIYSAKLFFLIKSGDTPDEAIEKMSSNPSYKEYEFDNIITELSFPIKDTIENKEITLQATINMSNILEFNKEKNITQRLESVILKEEPHMPSNKEIVDMPPHVLPIDTKPKVKSKPKPVKPKEENELFFSIRIRNFLTNPDYRVIRKDIEVEINGRVGQSSVILGRNAVEYIDFSIPRNEKILKFRVQTITYVEIFDGYTPNYTTKKIKGYGEGKILNSGCYDILTDCDPFKDTSQRRQVKIVACD